jgi:hypothetical protein
MQDAQLVVVSQLTQPIYRYMQAGGKAIWLAEDDSNAMGLNTWKIQRRHRTHWQGDWASSFSWIAGDGPFTNLPAYGSVDFLFAGITPDHVICEVKPEEFATNVHAGIFVGWLRQNAALVGERRIGEGRLMISTFQLSANLKTNPLAAIMFHDMVAHMTAN